MSLTKVFVYKWDISTQPIASCLRDDRSSIRIKFCDYTPSFNILYTQEIYDEVCVLNNIRSISISENSISSSCTNIKKYIKVTCNDLNVYNKTIYKLKKSHNNELYEYPDPFVAFLCQNNLSTCGTYLCRISSNRHTILSNFASCKQMEDMFPKPNIMAFDIECEHSTNRFPRSCVINDIIICIGIKIDGTISKDIMLTIKDNNISNFECIKFNNEIDMIQAFFRIILDYNINCLTSYNGLDFDIKYIKDRLLLNLCKPIDGITIIDVASSIKYDRGRHVCMLYTNKCISIDVYEYVKANTRIEPKTLDHVSEVILNDKKMGTYFDSYYDYIKTNDIRDIDSILTYCMKDVDLTIRLFNKMNIWKDVALLSEVQYVYMDKYLMLGHSTMSVNMFMSECIHRDIILDVHRKDTSDRGYTGGANFATSGDFRNVSLLDFSSQYPSIISMMNICHRTLTDDVQNSVSINTDNGIVRFRTDVEGIIPSIMKRLIKERKDSRDPVRGHALKIAANSFYGALGTIESKLLVSLPCARAITACGRQLIHKTMEICNSRGLNIVYADTDSVGIEFGNKDEKDIMNISNSISKSVHDYYRSMNLTPPSLSFKSIYTRMIILTKKKYITLKDNKIEYLGCDAIKKDKCKYMRDSYKKLVNLIMYNKDIKEIEQFIYETFSKLISGHVDISSLIMLKGATFTSKSNSPTYILSKRLIDSGIDIDNISKISTIYICKIGETYKKVSDILYSVQEYNKEEYYICYNKYISDLCNPFDQLLSICNIDINVDEIASEFN